MDELKTRIRECLEGLNEKAAAPYRLTVSIGCPKALPGIPLKELIEEADKQLYTAKANRR